MLDHVPHNGCPTSRAAGESMRHRMAALRAQIYCLIQGAGERGLTADELEVLTGLSHQTCSPRPGELRDLGVIEDSGMRRPTRSGRAAIVWRAKALQTSLLK